MSGAVMQGCDPFAFDGGPIGAHLQHGFTGCPASMRPLGEFLSAHGVAAVGPRLPGHGTRWEDLSDVTAEDWERESERALLELASRCTDVITVGLSFGGAMALHLAAKHPDIVRGVVAINAYVWDPRLLASGVGALLMKSRKGVGNDIKKQGVDEIAYDRMPMRVLPHVGRFIRRVEKELPSIRQPALVFNSPEDHTVKPVNSRKIMQKLGSSQKELIELRNSYHVATLDFDADLINQRVLEFATSLASAGPGATG